MSAASNFVARAAETSSPATLSAPPQFKIVGILLAIVSGLLIGSSFVFKKKGLLASQGNNLGEGVAYLKSWLWWTGMIMMIVGELCNFAAYAFVEAVVVTPLGALSVVVCAILSHFFLGESLTFFGVIGCVLAVLGSTIIALNSPQEPTVGFIRDFEKLFIAPGFLTWLGVMVVASLILMVYFVPRYGKQSMLYSIAVCSMIGGLSVTCTTGLGASIVTSIRGQNQFNYWFIYFLLGFVAVTLVTEIVYLNKALALFNTALVTPTYFVIFTSCTLISSIILFQGLHAPVTQIITMVMGFLVICMGITLLQMSKVDPSTFNQSKLDRRSTMLLQASRRGTELQEKSIAGFEDPGIDALRGGFGTVGSIIRARSVHRMSTTNTLPGSPAFRNRAAPGSAGPGAGGFASDMPRHQLWDAPVPGVMGSDENAERISMQNTNTPSMAAARSPTIKFNAQDTAHFYPSPGLPGTARHESLRPGELHHGVRNVPSPISERSNETYDGLPPPATRGFPPSASPYHPQRQFSDPFKDPHSAPPLANTAQLSSRRHPAFAQQNSSDEEIAAMNKARGKNGGRDYPRTLTDNEERMGLFSNEGALRTSSSDEGSRSGSRQGSVEDSGGGVKPIRLLPSAPPAGRI